MSALDAIRAYQEPRYLDKSIATAMRHVAIWCWKLGIDQESAVALFRAHWDETERRLGLVSQNGRQASVSGQET
jgi:hypothetical protein